MRFFAAELVFPFTSKTYLYARVGSRWYPLPDGAVTTRDYIPIGDVSIPMYSIEGSAITLLYGSDRQHDIRKGIAYGPIDMQCLVDDMLEGQPHRGSDNITIGDVLDAASSTLELLAPSAQEFYLQR